MSFRQASRLLARALHPLRHLLPMAWRIEIKTWIRDRSDSRPGLNRLLRWLQGPPRRRRFLPEEALPSPRPEDRRDNPLRESPLLSVIIPFFNHGGFLMEALGSVWRQTFQDFEVIVVDDGSDDPASLDVLKTIEEPRTRVIRQANRGLPAARNAGLHQARGHYLCCLDADDALRPTHFEKLLLALESRQCDLAHCDLERFDQAEGFWRGEGFHAEALLRGNAVGNAAIGVVRRDAWERVGGYNESLAGYQDWDFWLSLAATGCQGAHVPEPLFLYRRHGTSMISRSARRHRELVGQIRERHRDLHENPDKVQALEAARRRTLARDPFVNLGPERHLPPPPGRSRCLLLTRSLSEGRGAEAFDRLGQLLRSRDDWEMVAVAMEASDRAGEIIAGLKGEGIRCHHARPMMPSEHAAQLPAHLCRAHRVEALLTTDDALDPAALSRLRGQSPQLRWVDLPSEGDLSRFIAEFVSGPMAGPEERG
jgi:hypothetical protein